MQRNKKISGQPSHSLIFFSQQQQKLLCDFLCPLSGLTLQSVPGSTQMSLLCHSAGQQKEGSNFILQHAHIEAMIIEQYWC